MRLLFKKTDGEEMLIDREKSAAKMTEIGAASEMVIASMSAGIPFLADDGEYTIVGENEETMEDFFDEAKYEALSDTHR